MRVKPSIAIYIGHDAGAAVHDGERVIQIEFEKIQRYKHYLPTARNRIGRRMFAECIEETLRVLKRDYDIDNDFHNLICKGYTRYSQDAVMHRYLQDKIKHINWVDINSIQHHRLHCMSAYWQSPFDKAMVMTYDGGGDDYYSMVSAYTGERTHYNNGHLLTVGWLFTNIPDFLFKSSIEPIEFNGMTDRANRIDHAGKMMGLSAYGKYSKDSYDTFKHYFDSVYEATKQQLIDEDPPYPTEHGYRMVKHWKGRYWKDKVNNEHMLVEDEMQIAWEIQEIGRLAVKKYLEEHILDEIHKFDNNLCIGGGCGLNVLINTWIREEYPHINTYVPSDPGDAGLALGLLFEWERSKVPRSRNFALSEIRLFDIETLPDMIEKRSAIEIQVEDLLQIIEEGKIVGFIYGGLEVGPRALGRRSIICDPSIPNMKNKINAQVKHREWYRPFAPVVRKNDVEKYFNGPSYENLEHMSYALYTNEEWVEKLSAVTHVDGTARVQALDREDSPYLWDLLEMKSEPKVLLNTSFNIGGKPTLNLLDDAIWMLDNRGLDHVVVIEDDKMWKFDPQGAWTEEQYEGINKGIDRYI